MCAIPEFTNFPLRPIRRMNQIPAILPALNFEDYGFKVMLDVISQATETKNKFQGLPLGAKAIQIADGRVSNYFLTTFGRAKRENSLLL